MRALEGHASQPTAPAALPNAAQTKHGRAGSDEEPVRNSGHDGVESHDTECTSAQPPNPDLAAVTDLLGVRDGNGPEAYPGLCAAQ